MTIVTVCKGCGKEFEADRATIMAGPRAWRYCPACRETKPTAPADRPMPRPSAANAGVAA